MDATITPTKCILLILIGASLGVWIVAAFLRDIHSDPTALSEEKHMRDSDPPYPGDSLSHLHVFLQVSDLHISRYYDKQRAPDFEEFCRINILKAIQPEVVLVSGDLTDAKLPDKLGSRQYEDEWQSYYKVLQQTGVMNKTIWLDIRGNHDAFDVPSLESHKNFFNIYSSQGRHNKQSYKYVHKASDGDVYTFIAVDACPNPGLKRPFNFFGLIDRERLDVLEQYGRESTGSNMTVWFGHYPTSIVGGPQPGLKEILSQGAVYLCGHLHTLIGLVPNMYTAQANGTFELELGDWMDNRRYRVIAIDHDLFSFTDEYFRTWPVAMVTNPKSAEFVMPQHEPVGRMAHSTHIRIVAFSDAGVDHVDVSVDGGEVQSAQHAGSSLFVLPWQPSQYSAGLHQITVTVKDGAGRTRTIVHTFSLDNTKNGIGIRGKLVLMTDFIALLKCLFGVALFICVFPLVLLKTCHNRIHFAVSGQWSGCLAQCLQTWLRRFYLLSITNSIGYPLLFFHVYIAVGPWFIGEMLEGNIGACFVFGVWVNGIYVPGTLTYCYGMFQLVLFNLPLMLYLGRLLDISLCDHRQREKPVSLWSHTLVKALLDYGVFGLVVGWQSYLALLGFNRAYGRMALLMCPMRTWSVIFALVLRWLAVHRRSDIVHVAES